MKVFATCKLSHTLQTHLSMVTGDGAPLQRLYPTMTRDLLNSEEVHVEKESPYWLSDEEGIFLFTMCVVEHRLPRFLNPN